MRDYDNDDPGLGRVFGYGMAIIAGVVVVFTALNWLFLPVTAVNSVATVAHRIMSPDNAMQQYRWFHQQAGDLDAYPGQIAAAESALKYAETHAPERAMSRETELTGLRQVCMGAVQDYNQHAARLDAGFFRNPEHWLPVAAEGWAPLPVSYPSSWCDGGIK